jgi:murein DD-endopeptidase MepM/ murein hydrolase activator NlpD
MANLETFFSKLENIKVIDYSIPNAQYTPIDLSVTNSELTVIDIKNPEVFETFVENHLRKNKAKVAFGGYNETRNLYNKNSLFNDYQATERNIHIGMDLWIKAGTSVLAALDGYVYGFDYNAGAGNYGPTIILKHHLENHTFYTLYGHLSVKSIEVIEIGTLFKQGQELATLGDSAVNGGYAPHLHFQIIKNMEENISDYPGVCSQHNLEYYLENCPNPNLLLKIQ